MEFDKELDARGLNCPLPILRTKKALNDMASGQVLRILATDPARVPELRQAWRRLGCPAELKNSLYRALLLTEADVMASALPTFGPALTQALHDEWRIHSPGPARALLSRAGRAHFLQQVAVFISPAARQLGMAGKPR